MHVPDEPMVREPSGRAGPRTPLLHHRLHRRDFLKAAGVLGAAAGSGVASALPALASHEGLPKPIPGGTEIPGIGFIHFFFPEPGLDPSTITDWRGAVGLTVQRGRWEATDTTTGLPVPSPRGATEVFWEADIRYMKGLYVDVRGNRDRAAFAFI